ncbi:putative ubiquitin carboxyl-terminal hydrolase [Trypanosoma theileri]|uniref:Ubiquitin carboxyl-terminal hydrolase n=1 Tax=Trypanosoma theileri TaxID=67003 RepID=A0A1X0P4J5_9TRYP|nr:putative ubiquitin carboxyl-terminal hydrolase [Trypanosoma theileri]ORC91857.1 putative ubiquitin carboxyl-terminal hydrolase [Trypanosoma theileri]
MGKKWLPLESNPEVLNNYLKGLGIKEPKVAFYDVFGLDPDLLAFVPRPVFAMMLLFPVTDKIEEAEKEALLRQKDEVKEFMEKNKFFFSRQTIANACGTMAVIHALMNNIDRVGDLQEGSPLYDLRKVGMDMLPEERAKFIENYPTLDEEHRKACEEGVPENQSIDADTDLHFTCFVKINNRCVELDGRNPVPLLHDVCSDDESFLIAAAQAMKDRINLEPSSVRYNIIALANKGD